MAIPVLSTVAAWFKHEPYQCKCGFQPQNPKDAFEVNHEKNRPRSDFTKYDCPECNRTFQAVFCDCGRGYTCRAAFNRVSSTRHGEQETYKCACGEVLHVHQRM